MSLRYVIEDEDDGWGYWATLYRVNPDGTRTTVGSFGGEPEDNTHYRTYAWVVPALNEAYELGRDDEFLHRAALNGGDA